MHSGTAFNFITRSSRVSHYSNGGVRMITHAHIDIYVHDFDVLIIDKQELSPYNPKPDPISFDEQGSGVE